MAETHHCSAESGSMFHGLLKENKIRGRDEGRRIVLVLLGTVCGISLDMLLYCPQHLPVP